MSFAQPCFVRSQDHGYMGVLGDGFTQGFVDQYLAGRVVHMIISPDNIGNAKTDVVGNHGHVICRTAIRSPQNKVVKLFIIKTDTPFNQIIELRYPGFGCLEPHH